MIEPVGKGPEGFELKTIDMLSAMVKVFPEATISGMSYNFLHGATAWVRKNETNAFMVDVIPLNKDGDWCGIYYILNETYVVN